MLRLRRLSTELFRIIGVCERVVMRQPNFSRHLSYGLAWFLELERDVDFLIQQRTETEGEMEAAV